MSDSLLDRANKGIMGLKPYEPGRPIEQTQKELGLKNIIKLASNENPLGISPKALAVIASKSDLNRYPDGNATKFKEKVASLYNIKTSMITVGNGSNDLIEFVAKCFLSEGDNAIYSQHGFAIYPLAIQAAGATPIKADAKNWGHDLELMKNLIDENTKIIYIASPNNPTGTVLETNDLINFLKEVPANIAIFIDQAYFEYIEEDKYRVSFDLVKQFPNLIISRSFSKAHGLAALRLGYSVSSEEVSDFMNRVRQPFNANTLALAAGIEAINDEDHITKSLKINKQGLERVKIAFEKHNFDFIESYGNFISFDSQKDSDLSFDFFLKKGIILRSLKVYEMPTHLRVSIGLEEEIDIFLSVLEEYKRSLNA